MIDFLEVTQNPITLSLSTLISEDLAYIYGLFSVQNKYYSSYIFILSYSGGVLVGDLLLYGLGLILRNSSHSFLGKKIHTFLKTKESNNKKSVDSFNFFEEFLVFTRFIPGSRIPTYCYCGLTKYSLFKFSSILLLTAVLYTFVGVVIIKSLDVFDIENIEWKQKLLIAIASSVLSISIFKLFFVWRKLQNKYGESLKPLVISVLRYRYLEFWPLYFFYLPFVPYFLWLFIRYRGFSNALASNPALFMSGFIGECKSEIDLLLEEFLPRKKLKLIKLPVSEKEKSLIILTEMNFVFPVIVKPDSGMRGTGVILAKEQKEVEQYFLDSKKNLVVQEYCSYEKEWGVFYYRLPSESKGCIFSITNKEFPKVIGNGEDNLFNLVAKNHFVANRFQMIFSDELLDPLFVPAKGEEVVLVKRGSHSKGCIFRNGAQWLKPAYIDQLRRDLDLISGFHIGRVDIRFESLEGVSRGEYKIIEINGSGGESSNIYDPTFSRIKVYKVIMQQWSLIFKIGEMNLKAGVPRIKVFEFFKSIVQYRKEIV